MKIQTTMIKFNGKEDEIPGYLALPIEQGTYPGLIVIQEWWGLNEHIKDVTERFAYQGYAALAPDLYRGEKAVEPDEARKLAMELKHPQAIADIQSGINYLISQPYIAPRQIGVIGFCMGGGLALSMAIEGKDVGAVVVFYGGRNKLNSQTARQISAPILGIYGEDDHSIPLDIVYANEQTIKQVGKTVKFITYPEAPHAFFNDTRNSYRKESAEDAWNRTLEWFNQHLRV